ncbi:MAG TPA: Hpt domain-containing protein [Thermoanaerobaculia bacterium]|nr:Hpt domain-containing protein [Thermoanaerobaculia bacterium]
MGDPELDELRREFLAEAQEKIDEIQAALQSGRSKESLERVVYIAHQLKGSGGSYGFQKISTEAAELEKEVERAATGDGNLDAKIDEHVVNLRGEIERGSRELATSGLSS